MIIIVVMICTGCGQREIPPAPQPFPVQQGDGPRLYNEAVEYCYKGVTYVVFPYGNASVASVMLDKNSRIIPCGQ